MKTITKRVLVLLTASTLLLGVGCEPREKPSDRPGRGSAGGQVIGKVVREFQHFLIESGGADRFPTP